jgi:hypothetical protein
LSIEEGLRAHLIADGTVNGIVGSKIHPNMIPQDGTLPALVYTQISSNRELDIAGPQSFMQVRIQVDCWHNSYSGVKALADAVRVSLNGVGIASPRLLGTEPVQLVFLENDNDLSDFEGDRRDYRVSQDWAITYLET